MSWFTTSKCCFFVDLRLGTFIIAYLCLALEILQLVLSCPGVIEATYPAYSSVFKKNITPFDANLKKFFIFVMILAVCYKILLCVTLLVGLYKRRPDHLQMFYQGYCLLLPLQLVIFSIKVKREMRHVGVVFGLVVGLAVIYGLMMGYFIFLIRSYYFALNKETNYYNSKPAKKDTESPTYSTISEINEKGALLPPQFGIAKERGGIIYSIPPRGHLSGCGPPTPYGLHVNRGGITA